MEPSGGGCVRGGGSGGGGVEVPDPGDAVRKGRSVFLGLSLEACGDPLVQLGIQAVHVPDSFGDVSGEGVATASAGNPGGEVRGDGLPAETIRQHHHALVESLGQPDSAEVCFEILFRAFEQIA